MRANAATALGNRLVNGVNRHDHSPYDPARPPADLALAARCTLCWAPPQTSCQRNPPGNHLARYQDAERQGLLSRGALPAGGHVRDDGVAARCRRLSASRRAPSQAAAGGSVHGSGLTPVNPMEGRQHAEIRESITFRAARGPTTA